MPEEPKQDILSTAEVAALIKATWTALLAPSWPKNDLIDLGKLIYAKIPLSKIDVELYGRLRPHLMAVAQELGRHMKKAHAAPATDATPLEKKDG